MKLTRRDLLVWSAGAAAGLMVTPVPWKLLDDASIWSQNWPWIPQPARGPVEVKQTSCTLCPNGCGMKLKVSRGWPVGVAGVGTHPISRGGLCPLGFGAHQLNWHPQRMREVRRRNTTSSWSEARAAFATACSEGSIVIVDGYQGRATSSVFETFLQARKGSYRVVLASESRALAPYEAWSGVPASSLGYDLENTQTIVSFGAPMLDGWGSPGRFSRLWAERAAGSTDPQLRLIQVEASLSRTAGRAWRWIPVCPGSDAALAAGIARVLLEDRLVPARDLMPQLTLAEAAIQSGLSPDAIRDLARTLVARPFTVAIAADDNPAVAALNVVLDAVGASGGVVRRSKAVGSLASTGATLPSARAVLIDSSVPWDFVPQTDAEVFRFAAWDGGSSRADWLLPAPGFLEELTDVPTPPTSGIETYAVAPGLAKVAQEGQSAARFLNSIDSTLTTAEGVIHTRCSDLFRCRKGKLIGQEVTPIERVASVQKLEEELWKGAVWVGEEPRPGSLRCELKEWPTAVPAVHPESWSATWPAPVLPPLASKLYVESSLREAPEKRNA